MHVLIGLLLLPAIGLATLALGGLLWSSALDPDFPMPGLVVWPMLAAIVLIECAIAAMWVYLMRRILWL